MSRWNERDSICFVTFISMWHTICRVSYGLCHVQSYVAFLKRFWCHIQKNVTNNAGCHVAIACLHGCSPVPAIARVKSPWTIASCPYFYCNEVRMTLYLVRYWVLDELVVVSATASICVQRGLNCCEMQLRQLLLMPTWFQWLFSISSFIGSLFSSCYYFRTTFGRTLVLRQKLTPKKSFRCGFVWYTSTKKTQ